MAASNNNAPTAMDKEQIFGMAEKEMEYRVELFNKLTNTCFNKCIEKRYENLCSIISLSGLDNKFSGRHRFVQHILRFLLISFQDGSLFVHKQIFRIYYYI
ncbi:uncharacterized protein LOC131147648 isoform X1 [Malania oleifera]|uniref:uncharacterized protein LOC131147648 isoform X1 n=1 Tax=Malania oleifera TaxID=397392 RepID=UPI0025ADF0A1|nr:uncharacterized protein LOC131147648 isoform X1 [Malania oleifera]